MKTKLSVSALFAFILIPLGARADVPGRHPFFLHALTDLRDARWDLEHREGDPAVRANEDTAVAEVDRAIDEIKTAAAEDGKNLNSHPREDANLDRAGRLHHALEFLRKAQNDASGEEDNPETRGLRHRALEHIDAAIHATERAIYDWEHHV
jgi:hypothetical protein